MNLTPTVRSLLTVLYTALTAFGALIAAGEVTDLPTWVGIMVSVLSTTIGTLTVTPPQAGGTQQSVANPRVVD